MNKPPLIFWPSLGFLLYSIAAAVHQAWFIYHDGARNGADPGYYQLFVLAPLLLLAGPALALGVWLYKGGRAAIITTMVVAPFGYVAMVNGTNQLLNPGYNPSIGGTLVLGAGLAVALTEWLGVKSLRTLRGRIRSKHE